jgi:hypothetical protein
MPPIYTTKHDYLYVVPVVVLVLSPTFNLLNIDKESLQKLLTEKRI